MLNFAIDMKASCSPHEISAAAYEKTASIFRDDRAIRAAQALQNIGKTFAASSSNNLHEKGRQFEAKGLLMEGQLLMMNGNEVQAINVLSKASHLYQSLLNQNTKEAGQTLLRI